jgi:hypothetical protein
VHIEYACEGGPPRCVNNATALVNQVERATQMTMSNVTPLGVQQQTVKPAKKAPKTQTKGQRSKPAPTERKLTSLDNVKKLRRQHCAAGAVALLAGALTFLSVHHLAYGYKAVTGCAEWESLVSAVGIDVGFLLLEVAQLVTVREATLAFVARWANPAIAVTLCGSAALNSFAFMQGTSGPVATAAAVLMGCFLPGFIYVLTRVSAHLAHH